MARKENSMGKLDTSIQVKRIVDTYKNKYGIHCGWYNPRMTMLTWYAQEPTEKAKEGLKKDGFKDIIRLLELQDKSVTEESVWELMHRLEREEERCLRCRFMMEHWTEKLQPKLWRKQIRNFITDMVSHIRGLKQDLFLKKMH